MTTTAPANEIPHAALPGAHQPAGIPRTGLFVVLEGVSGSGKSTLAALIARRLGCPDQTQSDRGTPDTAADSPCALPDLAAAATH